MQRTRVPISLTHITHAGGGGGGGVPQQQPQTGSGSEGVVERYGPSWLIATYRTYAAVVWLWATEPILCEVPWTERAWL